MTPPAAAADAFSAAVEELAQKIAAANRQGRRLRIAGHNSKAFYGEPFAGDAAGVLSTETLNGVISYEPEELFITAGGGTPLRDIEAMLGARGQMLPFDPPQFGGRGTLGGAVAAGLAGPEKPHYGGARDSVLGVCLINGGGEKLRFGGRVMKNVAGYDISRLTAGALGTLGVIAEVTIKVLPRPPASLTCALELSAARAVAALSAHIRGGMPVTASFYAGGRLFARLRGGGDLSAFARKIGGDELNENDESFWRGVRDQEHAFFADGEAAGRFADGDAPEKGGGESLWRYDVPTAADAAADLADGAFEWHGALQWRRGGAAAAHFARAAKAGGGARLFRRAAGDDAGFLPPPPPPLMRLQRRLKAAFDANGALNFGRMYPGV